MMQPLGPSPEQMEEMKKRAPTPSFSGNGKKSNNPNLIPADDEAELHRSTEECYWF